jgi:hypothetical protein
MDDLLGTNSDLCRYEAVTPTPPSGVFFLATFYLTPALASPKFLTEEAVLGGSLVHKKM